MYKLRSCSNIFREINSSLVTTVQCVNCSDLVSLIFGKNFVKVKFLLKKLLKRVNLTKNTRKRDHAKKIFREINSLVTSLVTR